MLSATRGWERLKSERLVLSGDIQAGGFSDIEVITGQKMLEESHIKQ